MGFRVADGLEFRVWRLEVGVGGLALVAVDWHSHRAGSACSTAAIISCFPHLAVLGPFAAFSDGALEAIEELNKLEVFQAKCSRFSSC